MKRIYATLLTALVLLTIVIPVSASALSAQQFPSFDIVSVEKGKSVTIKTVNFPASDSFNVTMGKNGTKGIGGEVVGKTDSGKGGSFEATYTIPSTLADLDIIAIRLESPTSGYFAYNWFYNNTSTTVTATPEPSSSPEPAYSGFPTFSISSVVIDKSVTIVTKNLPPHDTFTVTMGKNGTKGMGGIEVGNTESGAGGAITVTYTIPSDLAGMSIIAIRMQSPSSGYFAYNWFYNASSTPTEQPTATPTPTPTATPTPSGYTGFPTFTITAVDQGKTVTISGVNFPPGDSFTVLMGAYGTKGINGETVTTTSTGKGGAVTETYTIPTTLASATRIAIRLESPTTGYFAYNWFLNSTYP